MEETTDSTSRDNIPSNEKDKRQNIVVPNAFTRYNKANKNTSETKDSLQVPVTGFKMPENSTKGNSNFAGFKPSIKNNNQQLSSSYMSDYEVASDRPGKYIQPKAINHEVYFISIPRKREGKCSKYLIMDVDKEPVLFSLLKSVEKKEDELSEDLRWDAFNAFIELQTDDETLFENKTKNINKRQDQKEKESQDFVEISINDEKNSSDYDVDTLNSLDNETNKEKKKILLEQLKKTSNKQSFDIEKLILVYPGYDLDYLYPKLKYTVLKFYELKEKKQKAEDAEQLNQDIKDKLKVSDSKKSNGCFDIYVKMPFLTEELLNATGNIDLFNTIDFDSHLEERQIPWDIKINKHKELNIEFDYEKDYWKFVKDIKQDNFDIEMNINDEENEECIFYDFYSISSNASNDMFWTNYAKEVEIEENSKLKQKNI